MACCIKFSLRCPSDTRRFASSCHLQNPSNLRLYNLLPTNPSSPNPKKISYSFARRRSSFTVKSHMATGEKKPISEERMLVYVPPHPLIKHWVSVLRNEQTPSPIFRNAMAELGRLLMYEAARDWLPTVVGEIQTPMDVATVEFIDPREPVAVIPILRAGLALAEHASSILPATKTYHLGIIRDEETLQPSIYLNKLPEKFPEDSRVFVVDPMLATGGTIVAALNLIKECGVENNQIKVISAIAAPPALQKLSETFPGLQVYTGIIDPTVDDKGYIIPGLGDAGDRSFGNAMAELGRLLMYEAARDWLPTVVGEIQTPMDVATVEFIDPREPVAVIPILRAGLALAEHASSILPATKTYHLGIIRDEETLQPSIYLNKLPEKFPEDSRVFVVDPMLATGGTIVAALNLIKECGVENNQIKVISAIAAPPALQKLSETFPGLQVYTGIIDPTVDDKGYIIPGLGDAGDRSFGT
ncbi:hypothetical protein G4B88_001841 [Cannabis sativa]|uniref:uracil phosphoribosyltransferase n=1 Tax=Cannabis sativa TaxID=3483 RepID=A0A7J6I250_CANSA|nr:hypothetical protein G4B88_001841 [Cannabis sativa]